MPPKERDFKQEDNRLANKNLFFSGRLDGDTSSDDFPFVYDTINREIVTQPSPVGAKLDLNLNSAVGSGGALFQRQTTMTAADATPSVANTNVLVTAGTTTITDFDDGKVGQVLYIKAATSITITHGTPIQLQGAANFDMVDGDVLQLIMSTDQVWHEVGRTVVAGSVDVLGPKTTTILIGPSSNSDSATYDYVTDGVDDDVEFQAAVDELGTSGGKITFREGTYSISTKVVIDNTYDNLSLQGMGASTIIKAADDLDDTLLEVDSVGSDALRLTMSDIYFDGNSANQTGTPTLVDVVAVDESTHVDRCWFFDTAGTALNVRPLITDAGVVSNCYFENWGGDGAVNNATTVRGCTFNPDDTAAPVTTNTFVFTNNYVTLPASYNATALTGSTFGDNIIDFVSSAGASAVAISASDAVHGNEISGSSSSNIASTGIFLRSSGGIAVGNKVSQLGNGIHIDNGSDETTVVSNVVENIETEGIFVDSNDCVVSGNVVRSTGQAVNNTYDAIFVDAGSDRNIITGNRVSSVAANKHRYGVNITTSTCTNNIVSNNILTNAQTGQFNDAGTGTVTDGSNVTS